MTERHWFPPAMAVVGGVMFGGFGLWAMVSRSSVFDQLAAFDPYNQHFLQDIGAFQIGIGAILLAIRFLPDGLTAALLGSAVGAGAHTVSHLLGTDLGGSPSVDIPTFSLITLLLVAVAVVRWSEVL